MSDDLRYYFFDNEADDNPPISSEEGWKQMQQLLNEELPLASKRNPRRHIFFITGTLTAFILLTTALPLKNYVEQHNTLPVDKIQTILKPQQELATPEYVNSNIISSNYITKHGPLNALSKVVPVSNKFNDAVGGIDDSNASNDILLNESSGKKNAGDILNKDDTTNSPKKTANKKDEPVAQNDQQKTPTKNIYKGWHLNAGIAENISLNNTTQSLHPYPFAELQYQFAPRFFAAASLALFSPVGSNANGIKKTVYLNDTSADVSRYNEKLNYKRLTYADLSLTAGVKLAKQISVQGGIQFSRTLATKTNTTLDPYDFDSNRIFVTDVGTLAPTPSAAPVYNNDVEARKWDIRYVAGVNYDIKKFSFGLQYQAGINPILKGTTASPDKNKLITLKAVYKFK